MKRSHLLWVPEMVINGQEKFLKGGNMKLAIVTLLLWSAQSFAGLSGPGINSCENPAYGKIIRKRYLSYADAAEAMGVEPVDLYGEEKLRAYAKRFGESYEFVRDNYLPNWEFSKVVQVEAKCDSQLVQAFLVYFGRSRFDKPSVVVRADEHDFVETDKGILASNGPVEVELLLEVDETPISVSDSDRGLPTSIYTPYKK